MSDQSTSDMEQTESKTVFVGPAQVPWWKFKLAEVVWKMTRGNPISAVEYIPGTHRAAKWAFEVCVMSRDIEEKLE